MAGTRFFISAGEPSGDLHAANLIAAIKRRDPEATFFGLGGPRMATEGCDLLHDMTVHGGHMFFVGPLLQVGMYLRIIREVDRELERRRPDVMIFVDYPGLNFILASRGRVRRIPSLWYIPPQLWAWASFRVHKMARRLTRLACIFPFEVDFYKQHNIDARFVGHPLLDHFAGQTLDAQAVAAARAKAGEKVVLLLPGSRKAEIAGLLPRYLEMGRLIRRKLPEVRLVVGCLNEAHAAQVRPILAQAADVPAEVFVGRTNELMSVADLALAKSGTTTLELAYYGTPMIALYPVNWLQYQLLGRWFITTPYLALPNAVAGRAVVPEYYLYWGGPERIADDAVDLLTNAQRNKQMRADLAEVRQKLGVPGASDRAAEAALDLVGRGLPPVPWWRSKWAV